MGNLKWKYLKRKKKKDMHFKSVMNVIKGEVISKSLRSKQSNIQLLVLTNRISFSTSLCNSLNLASIYLFRKTICECKNICADHLYRCCWEDHRERGHDNIWMLTVIVQNEEVICFLTRWESFCSSVKRRKEKEKKKKKIKPSAISFG